MVTALSLLPCRTVDGVSVLAQAPGVVCNTPQHRGFTIAAVALLVFVVGLVPLCVLVVNYISVVGATQQHTGLSRLVHRLLGCVAVSIQEAASTRLLTGPGSGPGPGLKGGPSGRSIAQQSTAVHPSGVGAAYKVAALPPPLVKQQDSGRSLGTDASSVSFLVGDGGKGKLCVSAAACTTGSFGGWCPCARNLQGLSAPLPKVYSSWRVLTGSLPRFA